MTWTLDWSAPNESRADDGERSLLGYAGWGQNDRMTDASDVLANIAHALHRMGVDPYEAFDRGLRAAVGDLEYGPEARRDEGRYPEED